MDHKDNQNSGLGHLDWENRSKPTKEHSEHHIMSSTHFNKDPLHLLSALQGPSIPMAVQMQLEFSQQAMLQIQWDNQNLRQLLTRQINYKRSLKTRA